MRSTIIRLINIGTVSDNKFENQRIQAINTLSLMGIVVSSGYGVVWFFYSLFPPLLLEIPYLFLYALLFLLNHLGYNRISGVLLGIVTTSQLAILSFVFLGKEVGMQYYFFMIPPLSFITVSEKDIPWIYSAIVFSMSFFLITEYSSLSSPYLVDVPQHAARFIHASSTIGMIMIISAVVMIFFTNLNKTQKQLEIQHEESEYLLLNILPEPIADRLKESPSLIADSYKNVTIFFADIVGFTAISEKMTPKKLVAVLNQVFILFDELADEFKLEKIKTIGDAYMVAGGMPVRKANHERDVANFALKVKERLAAFNKKNGSDFIVRMGIHSGPAVAGVIGYKKFIYDVWGDTVNTASRMESYSVPDEIQVSEYTYHKLKNNFRFKERGIIDIKGKGEMKTYLLQGMN